MKIIRCTSNCIMPPVIYIFIQWNTITLYYHHTAYGGLTLIINFPTIILATQSSKTNVRYQYCQPFKSCSNLIPCIRPEYHLKPFVCIFMLCVHRDLSRHMRFDTRLSRFYTAIGNERLLSCNCHKDYRMWLMGLTHLEYIFFQDTSI